MRRVLFLLAILLLIFQGSPVFGEMEILFSSEKDIKEAILNEIEGATSTIDLAIHEFSSLEMAQALLKAKGRGVKIRIITDSKQANLRSSKITSLIQGGIQVKVLGGKDKGVMNHRFVIFDGKKVFAGSYDWSDASAKKNYENILILTENEVTESYQKEFERLWREKRVIH